MSTVVTKNLAVQNSAGTASTNISFDGAKLVSTALDNSITATANLHDLGVGQTWQDVTASRAAGVNYTNTTGKPIVVTAQAGSTGSNSALALTTGGGVVWAFSVTGYSCSASIVVPNGATYILSTATNYTVWYELR